MKIFLKFVLSTNKYFDAKLDFIEQKNKKLGIDFRHRYIRALHSKLKNCSTFSLVFQIVENGKDQTCSINGYTLAGQSDKDWSETNCAWGQICLLINGLYNKFSLSIPDHKIVPMGPWSYVEKIRSEKNGEKLPLFRSTSIKSFFKGDARYTEACIAVIESFEYICKESLNLVYSERADRSSRLRSSNGLPYKWGTVKKHFNEKNYTEAGLSFLRNVAKILVCDKLVN